ncbi:MAG: CoA-binding protein [Fervidicoccaceae archaeon]
MRLIVQMLLLRDAVKKVNSVAIVGATPIEGKIGNIILRNIVDWGFNGDIFLVNPKYSSIHGYRAFPSLLDLPSIPDIVVIAIPEKDVGKVLEESAEIGAKLAVVITSNAEISENLKEEFRERMRIIGPNSAGITLSKYKLHASIEVPPSTGKVGIVAQSGAVGGVVLSRLSLLSSGVSFFFSLGNSADISVEDALEYAIDDDNTEAVIAYIEWLKNGRKFIDVASTLRKRGKPLCVLKGGRGEASEKAARSHTGGIATDYSLFKAAVRQAGGYLASDLDEVVEVCEVMRRIRIADEPKPIIITNSGGVGVISVSLMDELGIKVKIPSIEILPQKYGGKVKQGNPLDLGGDAYIDDILEVLSNNRLPEEFNLSVLIYVPTASEKPEKISEAIKKRAKDFSLPTIGMFAGAGSVEIIESVSSVIPVVSTSAILSKAIHALWMNRGNKDGDESS